MPKKSSRKRKSVITPPKEELPLQNQKIETQSLSNQVNKVASDTVKEVVLDVNRANLNEVKQPEKGGEIVPQEKSGKKLFVLGGMLTIIIIFIAIALFIFSIKNPNLQLTKIVKRETLTMPVTTTKHFLIRSEWALEVLNGSGIAGVAAEAASKLEKSGYKVIDISNADRSNYTENMLYISSEMIKESDLLLEDLRNDFAVSSISGTFESSTTASARLIIGKSM